MRETPFPGRALEPPAASRAPTEGTLLTERHPVGPRGDHVLGLRLPDGGAEGSSGTTGPGVAPIP